MPRSKKPRECACGCRSSTQGGAFLRGHNRRRLSPAGTKWCERCGEFRLLDEFGPNAARGYQPYCRKHQRQAVGESGKRHGRRWGREHRTRVRQAVLDAYGGRCACCGETEPVFLCLDHRDGVPDAHRGADGRRLASDKIMAKVAREGFPPDYRLLCWNCNSAVALLGECPHETATKEAACLSAEAAA